MDLVPSRPDRLPSPGFQPRDDDLVELLRSPDVDVRLQTLNRAITISKRDADWFVKFTRKGDLFKSLDRILAEDRWEVQHQCLRLLIEALPTFGTSLEYCMCFLMPNIISKMGSSKITVRRISVQLLQVYLKKEPDSIGALSKILVNILLSSNQSLSRMEIVAEVPSLFIPEVENSNWNTLVDGFTKWMLTTDEKSALQAATTLKKLQVFIGKEAFQRAFSALPKQQQDIYSNIETSIQVEQPVEKRIVTKTSAAERRFRYGIVPIYISAMMSDDDVAQKIAGLEKLKQLIEKITTEDIMRLVPHLHSYLMMLGHMASDLNIKVVVLALDVLRLTVNRLKSQIEAHMQQVISVLSQHFGNQKDIIKQLIMMTCMDLFQNVNPKAVTAALAVFLEHRNGRVREEVTNIITYALMIISGSKVNFTAVINMVVPLLLDPKRRVRMAAFEQLAVVAYLMNNRLDPLLKAVRTVETKYGHAGLLEAVQARIKRQQLPRIRYDGLIEYSIPSASSEDLSLPQNSDLHWIFHANSAENDRPVTPLSPLSSSQPINLESITANRLYPWDERPQKLDRMRSDDLIIRSQSETIGNPASTTSSWPGAPKRNNSIQDERANSAQPLKSNSSMAECRVSIDSVKKHAGDRRKELNNNIITHKPVVKKNSELLLLSKAKSESNISEDHENMPPSNYDDMPIRPAKSGAYAVPDFSDASFAAPVKKSSSHHSLPITNHAPLKNTHSNPSKNHGFLKSGATNRAQIAKEGKKEKVSSNSNSNGTVKASTVTAALKLISSEEWANKVDGLNSISHLSATNQKMVIDQLQETVNAVIEECKNLRSSVSRVALTTLGDLFKNLKSKMDSEIPKASVILMQRAGDVSNAFIRDDANEALQKMVSYSSPGKCLTSLIAAGSSSKNNTIRASCAQYVTTLVQKAGTSNVLNSPEINRLIPQLVAFASDPTPHVRQAGRQTLCDLNEDPSFDRLMRKNVNEGDYRAVRDILDTISKKGGLDALGATSMSLSSSLSRVGSVRSTASTQRKLPDGVQLDLDEIRKEMTAAGWENRLNGLRRFEQKCASSPNIVSKDTKLFEAFIGRLSDINSKVAAEALETFLGVLPYLKKSLSNESHLKAILNQLVLSLMSHLSSKSEDHNHLAQVSLKELVQQIDGAALSPAMAAATKKANVKQKPYMLAMFTAMNTKLYRTKPKQVEVNALPILWDCMKLALGDAKLKKAVHDYANSLSELLGPRMLLNQAAMELDASKRKELESMLK